MLLIVCMAKHSCLHGCYCRNTVGWACRIGPISMVQANHMIEQAFEFIGEGDKYSMLVRLLEREMDGRRLLIFCETKRGCDSVTRQLRTEGWPALSIHGDKSQQERDWVLAVRALPFWQHACSMQLIVGHCCLLLRKGQLGLCMRLGLSRCAHALGLQCTIMNAVRRAAYKAWRASPLCSSHVPMRRCGASAPGTAPRSAHSHNNMQSGAPFMCAGVQGWQQSSHARH